MGVAAQRRRLGRCQGYRSPEVVDGGEAVEVGEVVTEVAVSHSGPAVEALEAAKDRLDGGPPRRDQGVAALLPMRQTILVFVRAMHDAVFDAAGLERGTTDLALISLVAIDGFLVAADQRVC